MCTKGFEKEVRSALYRIELRQILLSRKLRIIMATLDDVLAVVTEEAGQIDSMIALITGLQKQLADALAGITLPAQVQAKVDAIFVQAKADSDKIVQAVNANTPPVVAPVVPEPTPVEPVSNVTPPVTPA